MQAVETIAVRQFEAEQRELRQQRARDRAASASVFNDDSKKDAAIVALVELLAALEIDPGTVVWHDGEEYVPHPTSEIVKAQAVVDSMRSPETVEGGK